MRLPTSLCLRVLASTLAVITAACSARLAPAPGIRGGSGTSSTSSSGASTGAVGADGGLPAEAGTDPITALNEFAAVVRAGAIDKVDVLFDIDNSASMGDKQTYLTQAIPDLINRLVNPDCLDASGNVVGASTAGACSPSTRVEFAPVHDLHLGIVTSALGSRLSEPAPTGVCDPNASAPAPFQNVSAHNDDQGHLVNRTLTFASGGASATEGSVDHASPGNYLDWAPSLAATGPVASEPSVGGAGTAGTLVGDAVALAGGVGTFGCGIESQLESWYRFLIQPDPYASLQPSSSSVTPAEMWVGVDAAVLQQRRDFLRPDSAVVIVVLTDENDSEIDVRSLGGQGYFFMRSTFQPPRGTSACANNPGDPACLSCSQAINSNDPACQAGTYKAQNDWGFDPNLRHVHMKAKYGLDPQYPVQRYVNGLTSVLVPDRHGEYEDTNGVATSNYLGRTDCTNPLFAASLPDGSQLDAAHLCSLPLGTRSPDLVFFAVIGGVPNELLHFTPGDAAASALTQADWTRIVGRNPLGYDYNGIDPHMIEDFRDRTTVTYPFAIDSSATNSLSPASAAPQTPDPVNGREWITDQEATPSTHVLRVDRQYACVFPLPTPRDCTLPQNESDCDCPSTADGLTPQESPPVCNGTMQIAAKAYPTTRELLVAKGVGPQGIVGSLCPIHVTDTAQGSDPLYGYRPTVSLIGDHLRTALAVPCLPQPLPQNNDGSANCVVLVQLPAAAGGSCANPACDPAQGLSPPPPSILSRYCQLQEAAYLGVGPPAGATDPASLSVCQLTQLVDGTLPSAGAVLDNPNDFDDTGSCVGSPEPGWCYLTGAAAGSCSQTIRFASGSPPAGALASLVCTTIPPMR